MRKQQKSTTQVEQREHFLTPENKKLYTINVSQIYHKPLTVEVPRQAFDPNTKVDPPDGSQRLW